MSETINNITAAIRKAYPYKTELHAHTNPVSDCSEVAPRKLAELYKELGYTAVCLTNHLDLGMGCTPEFWLGDYFAAKAVGDEIGINVILSAEVCLPGYDNHYLLYGLDPEDVSELFENLGKSVEEFSRIYRARGCFFNHAHPFRPGTVHADFALFDGVEAFNIHPKHNSKVARAARIARSEGKILTAGTDYHDYGDEGLSAMLSAFEPKTPADVAAILKSGDFLLEVGGCIVIP